MSKSLIDLALGMENKLCFGGRDEVNLIDLPRVAYFKAEADYVSVTYIGGLNLMISRSISDIESMLPATPSEQYHFVRVGRSYIINLRYLYRINMQSKSIILSDGEHKYALILSKEAVKNLKKMIE